ncbi:hypothetical protein EW145_g251 [Phellinidium pouzarii]|uniref:RanBD1 domain-containing protein n=1 Tax=Phellinidium pouzarii TaxID=167371 RepID=A0A4S4LJ28_9AGAM|nr:hypothetical protein EW145_g251 [Phellinidium pouzarii]
MSERADDVAVLSPNTVNDDQRPCESPPTPPSPEDADPSDLKGSRKREREVSLEPATPKPDEPTPISIERRTPVPKKNRVKLGTTKEEDETPPSSPGKTSMELATSPPYEIKVRQISRKVRGMVWDDQTPPEFTQDTGTSIDVCEPLTAGTNVQLEPAAEIAPANQATKMLWTRNTFDLDECPQPDAITTPGSQDDHVNQEVQPPTIMDSDIDEQEKRLKSKICDRLPSASVEKPTAKASSEPIKRSRDDNEEDTNPREKKRPTPPPEEQKNEDNKDEKVASISTTTEPAAPQPKVGGFLAYASTSSPFASTKGRSVFGTKSTPSPSPLAGTSNGAVSSLSSAFGSKPSPFAIASANKAASTSTSAFATSTVFSSNSSFSPNNLSTSPTGIKRSGFEAFASSPSPFATTGRSRSPPGGLGLVRSRSPTRRTPVSSINAFKSYVGSGTQSFAAPPPPVKKPRQDSGDNTEGGEPNASKALGIPTSNGVSPEGSEEEGEKPSTFTDRLRASKNVNESREGSEEVEKVVAVEREVFTGEEDEDTVFQVRGKLYALSDQNAWKERGTGLLKLNVRKSDGGGARLVMRKEAVFTLLLNVTLFKGMRCSAAQDPRYVRFSCIESGTTVHYNLRLSNPKVSGELIEEINSNIPSDEPGDAV